ncbi:MAG TPA: TldD/PmbA family protein [Vicinamibacterales bacterium]|nr:TldD/PmbA family protein [Vicinamibacterales bacterium]
MMEKKRAQEIIKQTLAWSKADEAQVSVSERASANLRFARNTASTTGAETGPSLTVTSVFGKQAGAVSVNQLDEATLKDAVARSEEIARLAPEDPERMPLLGQQEQQAVAAWDDATASEGPERMAAGAASVIAAAKGKDLVAAGFTRTMARAEALGNSKGLFAYHRGTAASFSTTVRTPDGSGSGWAGRAARAISDIDYAGAAAIAVDKAVASRAPRKLEPGNYPTILEPACVADLLELLVSGMDQRLADEGRSFFAAPKGGSRLGEKLFGKQIDIRSDPGDRDVPARPWSGEGLPHKPRHWIEAGKVTTLSCDRFWAAKKKVEPVAPAPNYIMAGGKGTLADLIKSTRRGVLVTSFWYIRDLDPQTMLSTGLTRDGVFWIENGAIAYPVNNFRWNDSPVAVLKKVEAMTASQRLPSRGSETPMTVVPAIRVSAFGFASISDAV